MKKRYSKSPASQAKYAVTIIFTLFCFGGFVDGQTTSAQSKIGDSTVADNVMAEDDFWSIIARSTPYEADPARQIEVLERSLRELSPVQIEAFERAFHREQLRAYSWKLWGAAYVIHGGASDDGFEYFQRWLISKGRKVFEAALADPDSLADLLARDMEGPCEFEEFAYVAGRVWADKTGINPGKDPKAGFPYTGASPAAKPTGTPFKEDRNYLKNEYPKLWARFGNSPL